MNYILDTNIISSILKGNQELKKKIAKVLLDGKEVLIHSICYYEIKRGLLAADAISQLKRFEDFVNKFKILFLDNRAVFDDASKIYATLKRKGKPIEDADILIAASCKQHGCVIVTDNIKHFERIKDIKFENWLAE